MVIAGLINMKNKVNQELWKYTKINCFKKFNFDCNKKLVFNKTIDDNTKIIKINNRTFTISNINNTKITLTDLNYSSKKKLPFYDLFFNKIIQNNNNPFININKDNYINGLYLNVKDNTSLSNPIIIKSNAIKTNKDVMESERFFLGIGKNVSGTIFIDEEILSECNLNTVFELFIDENSNIDLIHFSDKPKTTQIFNFSSLINKNSNLNYIPIDLSGKLIKKNLDCTLKQNSSCHFESLDMLNKNNYIDNFISINHYQKNTYSSTNQKNILKNQATDIFYAKATILKDSVNSSAHQNNNNLMLSHKAKMYSNPQLEIYNNDVKCSHGSTTGDLDNDALFYMQSRGIKPSECKKLILNGFANQITDKIKNDNIKKSINKKIKFWLDSDN